MREKQLRSADIVNKPTMILFDYGNTLLYEPDFSFLRGEEALFAHIKSNKYNLTARQIYDFSQELFAKIGVVREVGCELHEWQFQRFVHEYLGIELSVSYPEAEEILWNSVSAGAVMPGADKMLDYLNEHGIRSGVISNIGWSGALLTKRINCLLPRNRFEFVIASSEYMFRKPSSLLFELALRKADLDAADVWFCGDNILCDVEGSSAVGMFPVWYENLEIESPWNSQNKDMQPTCRHLHIHDWPELIDALEAIK
jgi:putative hydrolase of the HAD superfamily